MVANFLPFLFLSKVELCPWIFYFNLDASILIRYIILRKWDARITH